MKKILTLVLSMVLVLSCLTVPAFSAEAEYISAENTEVLRALGIVTENVQNDAKMTRAEATKYFCRLLGLEVADPTGFESIFYDVTSETPYYKYISTICKAGYMQGDGNGRFRPNAPISTMEAARVLTSLVGYKGYIAVSNLETVIGKTDILDGVSVVEELEFGQFFKMIYNILHAPACRETGYGATISFEISGDYLGVDYLYKIAKARGIVDGIKSTSLTDAGSEMHDGNITIDGNIYGYEKDASAFLGYSVDFYYRTDVDSYDIVYMSVSDRNKVMVLNYDEIIGYSNFEYEYEYKNSSKTVKINPETDVIYNGVACLAPTDDDMVPAFGKVTLISNDNDSVYDVVMIEDSEFMVVENINTTKEIIKDKLNEISLDYSEADEVVVTSGGKPVEIDRIYTGNLLEVKRSKADGGYYKISIDVTKNEITGAKVTAVSDEYVTANGEKYEIWDGIDGESEAILAIGNTVTIYPVDGMIVGAIAEDSSNSYAYLLTMSEPEVLSNKLRFRLVLPSLEEVVYEKNDKIKIDGVSLATASEIENALRAGAVCSIASTSDMPLAQPVIYTLSKDGKLLSLDTLYFNSEREDAVTSLRRADGNKYRYGSHNGGLYLDLNTFVATSSSYMGIPTSDKNEVMDYRKSAPSSAYFREGESTIYAMDICNVDPDTKVAGFVFYYSQADTTADDYGMYIVLSKSTELNSEGDTVNVLHLGYNGNTADYVVTEGMKKVYDELITGDLVNFDLNGKGEIKILEREARLATMLTNPPDKADRVGPQLSASGKNTTNKPPYEGARILYAGTALDISMGKLLYTPSLVTDPDGFDETYLTDSLTIGSATVYKYSVVRGEPVIEVGTMDDIVTWRTEPSKPTPILVYLVSSQVKYVFVVEN